MIAGKLAPRLKLSDKQIKATLQADYLFGRPAARLSADLVAKLAPARFESPGWRGWTFGDSADAGQAIRGEPSPLTRRIEAIEATTNDNGQATWPVDLDSDRMPYGERNSPGSNIRCSRLRSRSACIGSSAKCRLPAALP